MDTSIDLSAFIPSMLSTFCDTLAAEGKAEKNQMTAAQLRQVVQTLATIIRKTMPKGQPWTEVQRLWGAEDRLASVAAIVKEHRESPPLHQSLQAILRLIEPQESQRKKKRKNLEDSVIEPSTAETEPILQKKKKKRERQPESP